MESTKKFLKATSVIVTTSLLCISLIIVSLYVIFIHNLDKEEIDSEYAYYTVNQDITTEKYNIDKCDSLYFFDLFQYKTNFPNAIPNLKIINDESYYVEVTANKDLHKMLDIQTIDSTLAINCKSEYYKSVHENDNSYDYDYGIYIDCTQFDVVVYAPISKLFAETKLILDFDVASAEKVYIQFSYDGVEGIIKNINTQNLEFYCAGTSELELSGSVTEKADFNLYHNCHINAKNLSINKLKSYVSRQLGGYSYIRVNKWYLVRGTNLFAFSNIIELFVYGPAIAWAISDIILVCKIVKKHKKEKNCIS